MWRGERKSVALDAGGHAFQYAHFHAQERLKTAFGCLCFFQQGRNGRRSLADAAAQGRFKVEVLSGCGLDGSLFDWRNVRDLLGEGLVAYEVDALGGGVGDLRCEEA